MGFFCFQHFHQLRTFFHNRQIGTEIGIKHIVKAHTTQCCRKPFFGGQLVRQAQAFSPGRTHGRRNLYHRNLFWICQRSKYFFAVISGSERSHRTVGDALSAQHTVCCFYLAATVYAHSGPSTCIHHIPDADALYFAAHLNTAHTFDTAGFIANQWKILIPGYCLYLFGIGTVQNAQIIGNFLQYTVSAAAALGALTIVLG